MELTILDRILLAQILPPEGNIVTLRIVRDLRRDLSFSEEEIAKCRITEDKENNITNWYDTEYKADVKIGAKAKEIIKGMLEDLNAKGKLKEDYIPLYEAFVENEQ